jgi:dolichol kinase
MDRETKRQAVHLLVCMAALAVLLFLSRNWLLAITFSSLIVGSLLINMTMRNSKISLVGWFVSEFEREGVRLPGWGSACLATGVLILAAYLREPAAMAASLVVLGIGDGASTLIGRRGSVRLPWNAKKTAEGTLAFFVGSLAAWVFIGPLALPLAAVSALAESLDLGIDDNLVIPVVCTMVLMVL